MTLSYIFRTPAYWADGSAEARSDGHVDVTQSKPQPLQSHWMAWQTASQSADGTIGFDTLFGPTTAVGETTLKLPDRPGVSSDDPITFLRVVVSDNSQLWPLTPLDLATLPAASLPQVVGDRWYEVFYYGGYSYGPGQLPIISFTARPTSSVALDMRVSLDGGAP